MTDDIKKIIKEEGEKTRKHFDEKSDEIRNHFDVAAENLEHKLGNVSEQVAGNAVNITKIQETLMRHGERLESIETTLAAVNLPVLRQKFEALEKRVTMLEAKVSR